MRKAIGIAALILTMAGGAIGAIAEQRKYSVSEVDDLRRAVENKYLYGTYTLPRGSGVSRSYREDEKAKVVEEMVRTYILTGLTADDLRSSELKQLNP